MLRSLSNGWTDLLRVRLTWPKWAENDGLDQYIAQCWKNKTGRFRTVAYGSFLFVLQDGIEPAWEDPRNKKGGRWLVVLTKAQRQAELDNFWREIVSSNDEIIILY